MKTSEFDFHLPEKLIAQQPVEPRDASRLLHVKPDSISHHLFSDITELLSENDVLVMNDTKVIPAKLLGKRDTVNIEALLHKRISGASGFAQTWSCFARPGKRLKIGNIVVFGQDGNNIFTAEVLEKHDDGLVVFGFVVNDRADLSDAEFFAALSVFGQTPLPHYIKREEVSVNDVLRYQTVFAKHEGAVAAPTAGLHFTKEVLAALEAKKIQTLRLTLHTGAGTFMPVKKENIKDHVMHSEYGEISSAVCDSINEAKLKGKRIIAVGTTSTRLLESAADEDGIVQPFTKETDIFIAPSYKFKVPDALITNFHLPESTLFMLVCAFMGIETMKNAYECAIKEKYRFYSYGDASLLERMENYDDF
ncbi:MAG: tRNA preQ1(34) S-adenosylmethionine ribosyltransferase-isomerase QueA [Alphaproteobacteria bacterium]|nr:tRNA preQ1(34) S-adenosylmethionine ribosyltransferase-isomerase QueA [Alphaproteobacteria bacterium]MCL2505450.1 tRNA preQ1(34) S-adenosylmethionine ribosyltransferase-isomerase QueA [Alphaproteobacteria bacterium]